MASSAIDRELLSTYEGLHISAICTAVRFVDDAQNHCAHFVNHVLGISAPLSCGQLLGRPGAAANVRVHETFALCPTVGKFDDHPAEPCFAFVVQRSAVDLAAHTMQNVPKKHIGILCDGEIWHYSNAQRRVVRQTPEDFVRHFSGDGFALFFGSFPAVARALTVPSNVAAAGAAGAIVAMDPGVAVAVNVGVPELRRGLSDNVDVAVWQQFLIVRQLLVGPNIRTLLDGSFGPHTEDATEAFQISAGLPATGVVDAATNAAAIEQGFVPRFAATPRKALTAVTPAMTDAAVDALHRLSSVSVFYTEELLNVGGQRIVARLEPHKHNEGTQLRFWHRGITLYAFQADPPSPSPPSPPPPGAVGSAGMDTAVYPGDAVMADLRNRLAWTGFYLGPAPSHSSTSWMGKRNVLLGQGWGLAPIYVGQQESGPGSHHVDAAQGELDGTNAVALAQQAEFPPGTVLYLDIETGGPLSAAMRDYLQRWSARVKASGFAPGAYLSHTTADSARKAVPGLKLWVFRVRTADTNTEKDPPFRNSSPGDSGVPDAVAWQWAQNCRIASAAGPQLVDLNTATTSDPSIA